VTAAQGRGSWAVDFCFVSLHIPQHFLLLLLGFPLSTRCCCPRFLLLFRHWVYPRNYPRRVGRTIICIPRSSPTINGSFPANIDRLFCACRSCAVPFVDVIGFGYVTIALSIALALCRPTDSNTCTSLSPTPIIDHHYILTLPRWLSTFSVIFWLSSQ
jgi:hypothetical protein